MKEMYQLINEIFDSGKNTEHIANAIGVHKRTIGKYRDGQIKMSKERYGEFVDYFGEEFVVNGKSPLRSTAYTKMFPRREGNQRAPRISSLWTNVIKHKYKTVEKPYTVEAGPTEEYGKHLLKYILKECNEEITIIPRYFEGKEQELVDYLINDLNLKNPTWYYKNVYEDDAEYVFGYVKVER